MTRRRDNGAAIVLGTGEGAAFATSRLPDWSPSTEIGGRVKIAVLPGDGIGPEVVGEALRVLDALAGAGLPIETEQAPIGGAGYDAARHPLPEQSLSLARAADAVLLGAVGGPRYDTLPRELRPEQGILAIRKALGLFANLRPAILFPELAPASALKPDVIAGLDLMIVRELTGDIYFGQPRGRHTNAAGEIEAFDTMRYSESEIRRIAHVGFATARRRGRKLCSVDKANVLDTSILWREVVTATARDYPDVALSHMYVDNAAMQLVRNPRQFDVIVTGNLFGDILSDEASMLAGSIGMLPSASLDARQKGLYEPIHGSAPDIAGQGKANPLATILSLALMFRHTFARDDVAGRIESAVRTVLAQGYRTADIARAGEKIVGTRAMGDAVLAALAAD
jgi:3-isopropylmalate dehydrogenase